MPEDRGYEAGKIDARLADHDKHFAKINGSIERLANEVHNLVVETRLLRAEAQSRDETVVTTAAALKAAEDARRGNDADAWSPTARALALLAGVVGLISLLYAVGLFH